MSQWQGIISDLSQPLGMCAPAGKGQSGKGVPNTIRHSRDSPLTITSQGCTDVPFPLLKQTRVSRAAASWANSSQLPWPTFQVGSAGSRTRGLGAEWAGGQVGKLGISEGAGRWERLREGVGAGEEKSVRTLGLAQSLLSTVVGFLPGHLGQEGAGWSLNQKWYFIVLMKLALAALGAPYVHASSGKSSEGSTVTSGAGAPRSHPGPPPGHNDSRATMAEVKDDGRKAVGKWVCTSFSEAGQEGVF